MTDRWEAIVRQHAPVVLGAAWRILDNAADAEDVSQEVFFEAFRKWQRRPEAEWKNLFRRLAVCRALDARRRRKTSAPIAEVAEVASTVPGPAAVAASTESISLLRQTVDRLPRQQAEVFCLRYFEDLNPSEIAAALEIKPGAVATALSKARANLEPHFRPILQGDRS